jgi:hypothetical protein
LACKKITRYNPIFIIAVFFSSKDFCFSMSEGHSQRSDKNIQSSNSKRVALATLGQKHTIKQLQKSCTHNARTKTSMQGAKPQILVHQAFWKNAGEEKSFDFSEGLCEAKKCMRNSAFLVQVFFQRKRSAGEEIRTLERTKRQANSENKLTIISRLKPVGLTTPQPLLFH